MKNMRVFWGLALICGLLPLGSIFSQSEGFPPVGEILSDEAQMGYRTLIGYIQDKEQQSKAGKDFAIPTFLGLGGALMGTGAIIYFWGDEISQRSNGKNLDPEVKIGVSLGFGATGLVFVGAGGLMAALPPPNFRSKFQATINTTNPIYQEALAVAALKSIGVEARNNRLITGSTSILLPILYAGIFASSNISKGNPWYDGLAVNSYNLPLLISGITSLIFPTPEEGLYDKYLLAKSLLENE